MTKNSFEKGQDNSSPNRNIAPITAELDKNESLLIGGCSLNELAKNYGTPLYVIDEKTIRQSCKAYKMALDKYYDGKSLAIYASKANSSVAINAIIKSEGLGIDVVSAGELLAATDAGITGEKIFFHGNNKSDEELNLAYHNNATIVIDNYHDIDRLNSILPKDGKPARLMLRFTPGIECHTHEYIQTGHLDSKFGFDPDELKKVLKELKKYSWLKLIGLHAHIGSQIFELKPHKDLTEVMAETFLLAKDIGHPIEDINIGGGLGVRYISSDDPPSIESWVKEICDSLTQAFESRKFNLPRLICEPGRSLVANAGVTLYTIGSRKKVPSIRTYLSIDGGMSDNPRPITYESKYTACLADKPISHENEIVTIAGKHCESGDVLLKDLSLPPCSGGEVLVIFSTGAYNASMSSNYNRMPRPAAILVNNGHSDLIQKRETSRGLLVNDVLPDRLRR